MSNKITQRDINNLVWRACDTFRGVIDPSQYKDYILTMLFLKYVSDVHKDKLSEALKKYGGDKERADRAMKHERFIVPDHCTFDYLYDHRNESNIGELINIALNDLEELNNQQATEAKGKERELSEHNQLYQQKVNDLEQQLFTLAKQKIRGKKEASELLKNLETN